jgi:hypothetical protein
MECITQLICLTIFVYALMVRLVAARHMEYRYRVMLVLLVYLLRASTPNMYVSFNLSVMSVRPPLWSCGQSSPVRFPALPDFLRSSGSGTGSTQPREYN